MKHSQIYSVIKRLSSKYTITAMCEFYNVSRSGYYDWLKRLANDAKDSAIKELIIDCQKKHKGRFGYRRMTLWLKREKEIIINHKKVLRIMSKYNLLSKIRRRKLYYYKPNGNLKYENILKREFSANHPNEKWVSDISYIITANGTLYLSTIRDLHDDFIVGYKTSMRQDYSLVRETINSAISLESPSNKILLHTVGGGQYRSWDYHEQTKENNITPSMSKPGTPGDNSPAENFFSTFKSECIYLEKPKSVEEAAKLTDEFIEYYCFERIGLDGKTPWERRKLWFEKHSSGNL